MRAYVEHFDHDRLLITVCRVASSRAYVEKFFKLCFVQKFVSTPGEVTLYVFSKTLEEIKGHIDTIEDKKSGALI